MIGRTITGNEEIRVRLNPIGALQMITSLDTRFVFSGLYTYNKNTGDIKVDYTSAECVNCIVPGTVYPISMFNLGSEYRDFTLVDWTSDWLKVRRKVSGEELLFTTCSVFNPYDDSQLILY